MSTRFYVVTASLLLTGLASAQTIVNGDFELSVPSNGTGNGWTSEHIDGSGGWQATGGNSNGNFILNAGAEPDSDPSIFTTITGLTIGNTYTITGDFTNVYSQYGDPDVFSFGVYLDGVRKISAKKGTEGVWQNFSFDFTATATTATLLLAGEINDDSSFRVDNVAINAVPEPGTLAALATGGLVLLRRRRKRA